MAYVREEILARVLVIAKDVQGIMAAERNVPDVSKLQRPAIAIKDGSEQRLTAPRTDKRSAVQLMEASPAITLYVGASARDQGALANTFLARFLYAALHDSTLNALVGGDGNGEIRYEGADLQAPEAESREARMEINLVFVYPFIASAL